jgi:hypothetical protein
MVQDHYEGRSFPKKGCFECACIEFYREAISISPFLRWTWRACGINDSFWYYLVLKIRRIICITGSDTYINPLCLYSNLASFYFCYFLRKNCFLVIIWTIPFDLLSAEPIPESYDAEMIMNSNIDNTTLQKHQHVQIQMLRNQDVLQTSNGRWMIAMAYGAEIVLVGAISLTLFQLCLMSAGPANSLLQWSDGMQCIWSDHWVSALPMWMMDHLDKDCQEMITLSTLIQLLAGKLCKASGKKHND